MATKNLKNNNIIFTNTNADAYSNHHSRYHLKSKMTGMESGRSMVEMLGVLAIVGVLSIGSIMGYSYAMDKYRANTTVNDIMLRATDLLAQANQGHTELSLTEWEKEDTIYPISNADYANDGMVMLDAGLESNPISKRVCEMIFNDIFPHTVQIDINAVRGISNAACDENNIMTFYFDPSGAGPAVCEPACGDGEVCDNGKCYKTGKMDNWPGLTGDTCATDEDCMVGYTGTNCAYCYQKKYCAMQLDNRHAECTLSDGTPGLCTYGRCLPRECDDEHPCTGENEYCASPNTSAVKEFPNGETGTCVRANLHRYEIDGRVYYVSHNVMSWWHTRALCQALGLDFVPTEELYTYKGTDADGNWIWERKELMKKLRQLSGVPAFYGSEERENSPTARVLVAPSDEVTIWYKNAEGNAAALCR